MFSITIMVGGDLVEPVYDHVHHGRCFSILEQARCAMLESIGFPNEQLIREGKVLVITRVDVAYKREVKAGDATVTCEDIRYDDRTIIMRQRIINSRGKTAVEGEVHSMFMDMHSRRGMEAPSDFLTALLKERVNEG